MLQHCHQPIALHARRLWQTHRTWLTDRFRTVMTASLALLVSRRTQLRLWRQNLPLTALTTLVGPTRLKLRELRQKMHQVSCEAVRRAQNRSHRVHAHIQASSPDRYFALGLSYVTRGNGTLVRHCTEVEPCDAIEVHLRDGTVPATVKRKEG